MAAQSATISHNDLKPLVYKFLDRDYRIGFNNRGLIIVDLNNTDEIKVTHFSQQMLNLFTPSTHNYISDWVDERLKTVFEGIDKFMIDYTVVLGRSNWEVRHMRTHDILTYGDFRLKFSKKHSDDVLKYYFDYWSEHKKVEKTERLMKIK